MCAALSSYARACTIKGVTLWGWREHVCSECQVSWARAGLQVTAVPGGSLPWPSRVEGAGGRPHSQLPWLGSSRKPALGPSACREGPGTVATMP